MKHIIRLTLYLLGLFITALGINLAIKSNLGVTPISAFTLSISKITGFNFGTVTIVVYDIFVILQILILGRKFKFKSLLQTVFSFTFGYFLNSTAVLVNWINIQSYSMQLILMIISVVVTALGAMLFLNMDIVPNAPEGFVLAICEKRDNNFPKMKILFDCMCVILAVVLSLLFLGNITSIREGTIISALLTGKLIGIFSKPFVQWLKKVAFYNKGGSKK